MGRVKDGRREERARKEGDIMRNRERSTIKVINILIEDFMLHVHCSSCYTSHSLSQSLTLLYTAVPCSVVAAGGRVMNAWARTTNAKYSSPLPNKKKSLTVCKDKR